MHTVSSILALDLIRAGDPVVYGGADALDTPVRWVHVAEALDAAPVLSGGELVLTTGLLLDDVSGAAARAQIAALEEAGAAGLMVELLDGREGARDRLREAAAASALPVIVLRQTVRFVELTEAVHRGIVAEQLDEVEHARHVHEVFTDLSVRGAGAEEVVATAAALLDRPVILEDVLGHVLAFDSRDRGPAELLRDWEERSAATAAWSGAGDPAGGEAWAQSPVGAREAPWGRLILPDGLRRPSARETMVLERAGQALTIGRLTERDHADLRQQARTALLHELRQGSAHTLADAGARAELLGLVAAPLYLPLVLRVDRDPALGAIEVQRRGRALLHTVEEAVHAARASALGGVLGSDSVGVLLALPARALEESLLRRVGDHIAESASLARLGDGRWWSIGVAEACDSVAAAADALGQAEHIAAAAGALGLPTARARDVRLRGVLAMLGDDGRVRAFVHSELGALTTPERADDLALLEAYLRAGGNISELARVTFRSRPALYHRLGMLERELGVPLLGDAESLTSLHVAVLAFRLTATTG